MNSQLTLVSHALCPYVQRAAIVLIEKGVHFERRDIDLNNKPDWFLALSPLGKTPGFVRVEAGRLSIPDFSGNRYFNTLGNFVHVPRAGLVFISFATGDMLQLTGDVKIDFDNAARAEFSGAERVWHVDVRRCVFRPAVLPLRFTPGEPSPTSLATGSWTNALAGAIESNRIDPGPTGGVTED